MKSWHRYAITLVGGIAVGLGAAWALTNGGLGDGGIRRDVVIGGDQLIDVDEIGCFGRLSCASHAFQSARPRAGVHGP